MTDEETPRGDLRTPLEREEEEVIDSITPDAQARAAERFGDDQTLDRAIQAIQVYRRVARNPAATSAQRDQSTETADRIEAAIRGIEGVGPGPGISPGRLFVSAISAFPSTLFGLINEGIDIGSAVVNPNESLGEALSTAPNDFIEGFGLGTPFGDRDSDLNPIGFGEVSQNLFGDGGNRDLNDLLGLDNISFSGRTNSTGSERTPGLPGIGSFTPNQTVGFVGDVALDPLNFIRGGVRSALGVSADAALRAARNADDIGEATRLLNAAGDVRNVNRNVGQQITGRVVVNKRTLADDIRYLYPDTPEYNEISRIVDDVGPGGLSEAQLDDISAIYSKGLHFHVPFTHINFKISNSLLPQRIASGINAAAVNPALTFWDWMPGKWMGRGADRRALARAYRGQAGSGEDWARSVIGFDGTRRIRRVQPTFASQMGDATLRALSGRNTGNTRRRFNQVSEVARDEYDRANAALFDAVFDQNVPDTAVIGGANVGRARAAIDEVNAFAAEQGYIVGSHNNLLQTRADLADVVRRGGARNKVFREIADNLRPGQHWAGQEVRGLRNGRVDPDEVRDLWNQATAGLRGGVDPDFGDNFYAMLEAHVRGTSFSTAERRVYADLLDEGKLVTFSGGSILNDFKAFRDQVGAANATSDSYLRRSQQLDGQGNLIYQSPLEQTNNLRHLMRQFLLQDYILDVSRRVWRVRKRSNGELLPDSTAQNQRWVRVIDEPNPRIRRSAFRAGYDFVSGNVNPNQRNRFIRKLTPRSVNAMIDFDDLDWTHLSKDWRAVRNHWQALADGDQYLHAPSRAVSNSIRDESQRMFAAAAALLDVAAARGASDGLRLLLWDEARCLAGKATMTWHGAPNPTFESYVRHAENIASDPRAIQALEGQIQRLMNGTVGEQLEAFGSDFMADPRMAEQLAQRARIDLPIVIQGFVALTRFFKVNAISTPGFQQRNFSSAMWVESLFEHTVEDHRRANVIKSRYRRGDQVSDEERIIMERIDNDPAMQQITSQVTETLNRSGPVSGLNGGTRTGSLNTRQRLTQLPNARGGGVDTSTIPIDTLGIRPGIFSGLSGRFQRRIEELNDFYDRVYGSLNTQILGIADDGGVNVFENFTDIPRSAARNLNRRRRVRRNPDIDNPDSPDFEDIEYPDVERYTVEQTLRENHVIIEMLQGRSYEASFDQMMYAHIDYDNLTYFERNARSVIPFYTFMSRNLPLMIEMHMKRPQAFNQLYAWQQDLDDQYGDPLLTPGYFETFLSFFTPGGGTVRGDLQVNDVIENVWSISNGFKEAGLLGGVNASFQQVWSHTAPWLKLTAEVPFRNTAFLSQDLEGYEYATADINLPGPGEVSTFDLIHSVPGLPQLLEKAFVGQIIPFKFTNPDGTESDQTGYLVRRDFNHILEQAVPVLYRMQRLVGNDPVLQERASAAWMGFFIGGFNDLTDTETRSGAGTLLGDALALEQQVNEIGRMQQMGIITRGAPGTGPGLFERIGRGGNFNRN